jgi:hypothetical protein
MSLLLVLHKMNFLLLLRVGLAPSSIIRGEAHGFDGPAVTIDAGDVYGTTTLLPSATASVDKFLGIPFAKTRPVRDKSLPSTERDYCLFELLASDITLHRRRV